MMIGLISVHEVHDDENDGDGSDYDDDDDDSYRLFTPQTQTRQNCLAFSVLAV